jgi:hypothetical protein
VPANLILDTVIGSRNGSLDAKLVLYRRNGSIAWKRTFPLGRPENTSAALEGIAERVLSPMLETRANQLANERADEKASDPACTVPLFARLFRRSNVPLENYAGLTGVHSFDTRVVLRIGGKQVQAPHTVLVPANIPVSINSPRLLQLSSDTCVLTGYTGTVPVYPGGCIVVPGQGATLGFSYVCGPKAWPLDISSILNSNVWGDDGAPSGPRLLGGLPFVLHQGKPHVWKADVAAAGAPRPVTLEITVGRPSISRVYFLLNTEWGQPGPQSYLSLEFAGDKGARSIKQLVGGVDVRDYHRGVYVNSINGTTSRLAYQTTDAEGIDMVEVDLPPEFHSQTLLKIVLHDTGRHGFQRAILRAVTVR